MVWLRVPFIITERWKTNHRLLIRRGEKRKIYYFLEDGYKRLMKCSLLRKFKVVPYIQYVVAYHLRLFLLESNREVVMEMVPEEEMQAFKDRLSNVLQKVSDEVICSMNTALPVIEMELSLKYKRKSELRGRLRIMIWFSNMEKTISKIIRT